MGFAPRFPRWLPSALASRLWKLLRSHSTRKEFCDRKVNSSVETAIERLRISHCHQRKLWSPPETEGNKKKSWSLSYGRTFHLLSSSKLASSAISVKFIHFLPAVVNLEQNVTCNSCTLFFFHKNIVFPAQAEYSYFSANFRLKIFLYYS